jgi:L-lactate dehydrogenase complex protein LldG
VDTSAARRNILARIRTAQRRTGVATELERAAAEDYLARHPEGPRPDLPVSRVELVARFSEEARRLSTTIAEIERLDQAPLEAARYLQSLNLGVDAIAWRSLGELPWRQAGIQVQLRKPLDADLIGITGCFCATAETGSVVLLSGPDTPASTALLPQTHIAIVPASRIVAAHEDAFALMRAERGELPRAVNFVSGPSRTGDIEQTIVLGAHGPYRVHVIIVTGA